MCQNTRLKQFKGERVYSGSQFHGRESMVILMAAGRCSSCLRCWKCEMTGSVSANQERESLQWNFDPTCIGNRVINQGKFKVHWWVHQRQGYSKMGETFPQASGGI